MRIGPRRPRQIHLRARRDGSINRCWGRPNDAIVGIPIALQAGDRKLGFEAHMTEVSVLNQREVLNRA